MSYYCKDAYMDQRGYYDEDHSMDEHGYGLKSRYNDEDDLWSEESFEDNAQPTRYDEEYLWHEQGSLSIMNEEKTSQEESHIISMLKQIISSQEKSFVLSTLTQVAANQARLQEESKKIFEQLGEICAQHEKLNESYQRMLALTIDEEVMEEMENVIHHSEERVESEGETFDVVQDDLPLVFVSVPKSLVDEEKVKVVEPLEDQNRNDLVENFIDQPIGNPPIEVDKSVIENPRRWAHVRVIGDEGVPIKLKSSVEDPFFPTLEKDKFEAFQPFISKSFGGRSYNHVMLEGEHFIKGLKIHRNVHCKLGGREFKWDLKRDKIYSRHHLRRDPSKGLLKCDSILRRVSATS